MDAYLVIGNPNTRKASVVRCLTGCFNRSIRDIRAAGAKSAFRLYARVGCLQDTKTSPDAFFDEAARTRCAAVLCCLATSANPVDPGLFPGAPAYLARFKAAGWKIRAIAVLGQNDGGVRSSVMRQFPLASTAAINVTAAAVRQHFGWE
jgi:hypothetical protein